MRKAIVLFLIILPLFGSSPGAFLCEKFGSRNKINILFVLPAENNLQCKCKCYNNLPYQQWKRIMGLFEDHPEITMKILIPKGNNGFIEESTDKIEKVKIAFSSDIPLTLLCKGSILLMEIKGNIDMNNFRKIFELVKGSQE